MSQFVIFKRLGYIHIHVDCSTIQKAAIISTYIHLWTSINILTTNFSQETQSVILVGKSTIDLSDTELNNIVENAINCQK